MSRESWIFLGVLIPSVILHEVSHGVVALFFGDDTAKRAGRLTLNPVAHVDPFGTIILPLMLVLTAGTAFGYAKPVPVSPGRLRRPREQSLYVSLAGPATNLLLALLATLLLTRLRPRGTTFDVIDEAIAANVILAVFNLIPFPPLDGSALVERLLPAAWWPGWLKFRQYSMGLLLIVVLVLPTYTHHNVLGDVFGRALRLWDRHVIRPLL